MQLIVYITDRDRRRVAAREQIKLKNLLLFHMLKVIDTCIPRGLQLRPGTSGSFSVPSESEEAASVDE